jgi:hypothetical protein
VCTLAVKKISGQVSTCLRHKLEEDIKMYLGVIGYGAVNLIQLVQCSVYTEINLRAP